MVEGIVHLLFQIDFPVFALAEECMKTIAGLPKCFQTGSQTQLSIIVREEKFMVLNTALKFDKEKGREKLSQRVWIAAAKRQSRVPALERSCFTFLLSPPNLATGVWRSLTRRPQKLPCSNRSWGSWGSGYS